jgi:BMFP domain-containing protein YqiC
MRAAIQLLKPKHRYQISSLKVLFTTLFYDIKNVMHAIPDIMRSKIDIPRIWFRCCSPEVGESRDSVLFPFLSQQNEVPADVWLQQQQDLNELTQRYPLSAVRLWSEDLLFADASSHLPDNIAFKLERAAKLLQDSPIVQSMQHNIEQQDRLLGQAFQTASDCSLWMIDDIFGEEAVAAKTYVKSADAGPVCFDEIQHVCSIISDSFQACAALHVHAAAATVDRFNNNVEYVQQSEAMTEMLSELEVLRPEVASNFESIAARESEIESLRQKIDRLESNFTDSQSLQFELQKAMSENAALRDRIQKLEIRILDQPSNTQQQRGVATQPIECLVYIAKVDFIGDGPNQLPLQKDDRVVVVMEDDLGWARGICKGRVGLFPTVICEKTPQVQLVDVTPDQVSLLEGAYARTLLKRTC